MMEASMAGEIQAPFDIPPGQLVTLNDPDGNIVGLIDNSKGGMPEQF